VAYALDKNYRTLSGAAAISDSPGGASVTPLTFRIVGDGKELWRATMQKAGSPQGLKLSVDGVSKLELFVDCPGSAHAAHATWIDLELTRAGAPAAGSGKSRPEKPKPKGRDSQSGKAGGGVTADKLVIWNINSNRSKDRGMLTCNIELRKGGSVVWSKQRIDLAWGSEPEPATTIPLPKVPFDTLRVESTKFHERGAALSEVEIFRGRNNIALGKPATASASYDARFPASTVVDGIRDSSQLNVGYWVAPDNQNAWIEVQVAQPNVERNDVTITKAVYGLGPKQVDVTELLQKAVSGGGYVAIQADLRVFVDPAPYSPKRLVVSGTVGTNPFSFDLDENQVGPLPDFPAKGTKVTGASNRFAIVAAKYGAGSTWTDITAAVAKEVGDPKAPFDPNVFTRDLPDPWSGVEKHVVVWFDHRGLRYVRTFGPSESRPLLP
jgi:hypothetical protein